MPGLSTDEYEVVLDHIEQLTGTRPERMWVVWPRAPRKIHMIGLTRIHWDEKKRLAPLCIPGAMGIAPSFKTSESWEEVDCKNCLKIKKKMEVSK